MGETSFLPKELCWQVVSYFPPCDIRHIRRISYFQTILQDKSLLKEYRNNWKLYQRYHPNLEEYLRYLLQSKWPLPPKHREKWCLLARLAVEENMISLIEQMPKTPEILQIVAITAIRRQNLKVEEYIKRSGIHIGWGGVINDLISSNEDAVDSLTYMVNRGYSDWNRIMRISGGGRYYFLALDRIEYSISPESKKWILFFLILLQYSISLPFLPLLGIFYPESIPQLIIPTIYVIGYLLGSRGG